MIFPSGRLILLAALAALPLGLLHAGPVGPQILPRLVAAAVLGLTAVDAILAVRSQRGLTISCPEIVRLIRNETGTLELLVHDGGRKRPGLVLGLGLPPGLDSPTDRFRPDLPGDGGATRLSWPLRGTRRGQFIPRGIFVRSLSPLGLWHHQAAHPCRTQIRVYPNLLGERKQLAAYFLTRSGPGSVSRRPVGKGREYEKLREYLPGDSPADIHWKATARRGELVTKEYQIERTQEIYVAIDSSRLSGRTGLSLSGTPADRDPVLEGFITAALLLGMVAQRQGDRFGLLTFDNQVRTFLRAGAGSAHYRACRDAIYDLHPSPANPDFSELSSFINLRLRKRCLLFLLTSLDDPALAESFVRDMEVVNRRHLVLVNILRPDHAAPLFTGGPVADAEDIYARLAGHLLFTDLEELRVRLKRKGMDLALLERPELSSELVTRYMEVKRRQLL